MFYCITFWVKTKEVRVDPTTNTWISVHEEIKRKNQTLTALYKHSSFHQHCCPRRGCKQQNCILYFWLTVHKPVLYPNHLSEKPRREPNPDFCCCFWGSELDQRTEPGHVPGCCSLEIFQLVVPRCTPITPPAFPNIPHCLGNQSCRWHFVCCGCDRSPWLFVLF